MISKENLQKEIDALTSVESQTNGHFNKSLVHLGNNRYGIDIFSVTIKGMKEQKYLHLTGIYKKGVIDLLENIGFFTKRVHGANFLIQKINNIIRTVDIKEIKDFINEYLHQLNDLMVNIEGLKEIFTIEAQQEIFYRQVNMVMNEGFLEFLSNDESEIIRDTSELSYVYFENGVIRISKEGTELLPYHVLDKKVVWKDRIIQFNIRKQDVETSHFAQFIKNVCNNEEKRIEALKSGIGYLLHSFHRNSGGQMVLLYDESITDLDNPQGGTGKGIIAKGISKIRKTTKIDGKKFKGDNRFDFQDVTLDTQVLWLDDVGKQVDIDRFNSISTDGFNIEQKFKGSIIIPGEESPKIIICSNIILACSGSTRKRRQFIVELSPFYSRKIRTGVEEPIVNEHGCRFFSDEWDDQEWNKFYWFMLDCIKLYLTNGLVSQPSKNVIENRVRQTIGDEMYNWIKEQQFEVEKDYDTKQFYEDYRQSYEAGNDKFSQRAFSNKLKNYFTLKEFQVIHACQSIGGKKTSFFRIKKQEND